MAYFQIFTDLAYIVYTFLDDAYRFLNYVIDLSDKTTHLIDSRVWICKNTLSLKQVTFNNVAKNITAPSDIFFKFLEVVPECIYNMSVQYQVEMLASTCKFEVPVTRGLFWVVSCLNYRKADIKYITPKNNYYQFSLKADMSFGRVKETSQRDVSFMYPKHM